ncbi:hypothetical protein NWF32_10540 [Pseudomonas qingdaonensis]|nr:hypothetical protein [Pseudomonas qingdaonensis]
MTEKSKPSNTQNAWIAIDRGLSIDETLAPYTLQLKGERSLYQAIADDDWVLILNAFGHITRVGRIMRVRSDLETTTIYFDRMLLAEPTVSIGLTSFTPPSSGSVGPIQWTDFVESLPKALHKTIADVPAIGNQAYIRELLQLAVMDDLLGPAGGPVNVSSIWVCGIAIWLANWPRVRPHRAVLRGWTGHWPMTRPKSPPSLRSPVGTSPVRSLELLPGGWSRVRFG